MMMASTRFVTSVQEENSVLTARPSPLELLHPAGRVTRSRVIGSACPTHLLPAAPSNWVASVDLLIFAPDEMQCRERNWLRAAVQTAAAALAGDGVGYVLVPRQWRLHTIMLFRHYGLSAGPTVAHFRDWAESRFLIPLMPGPAAYAFSDMLPLTAWRRGLLALGLRLPGVANLLPFVRAANAFIVRHRGTRPLSEWLFRLCDNGDSLHCPDGVVLSTSWRESGGAAVLHCFDEGKTGPAATAKVAPIAASSVPDAEAALLSRLGPDARRAGVSVPRPRFVGRHGDWMVLLETAVRGRSAAHHLREHPDRLPVILEQLTAWLERWHHLTAVTKPLDTQYLESALLQPLALLAPSLEGSAEYYHWLKRQCVAATGAPMPFVASHNDLTMDNVLLQKQGNLGILDWETAVESGFPLTDFYYAVVDAVAATENYATRLEGFRICFTANGAQWFSVARLEQRLIRALPDLSPALVNLCFHACWLHHALNEQATTHPADHRPFLTILQWVALNYRTQQRAHA